MAVSNSLVKKTAKTGLTAYLTQDAVKKQINSVVGGKNGTRFISSIVSAVQTTPALQECTNPSILSAMQMSAIFQHTKYIRDAEHPRNANAKAWEWQRSFRRTSQTFS